MSMSFRLVTALAFASVAVAGCAPTAAQPTESAAQDGVMLVPLEIETRNGVLRYQVEVAITPQEQARGLMYRTSLPDRGGMIFPMAPARFASFWMKNTYVPLDIIFIRPDGHIARIAANAAPESLDVIDSGEPVAAVLEIIGGDAAKNGIAEGDRVRWTARPQS